YLNVSEAAEHANVTRATLYRWIEKGLTVEGKLLYLTAVTIGGQYRIEEPGLNRFLDAIGYELEPDDSGEDEPNSEP
ncbi:unnamed protein product, partial [marine sediment metagenome]